MASSIYMTQVSSLSVLSTICKPKLNCNIKSSSNFASSTEKVATKQTQDYKYKQRVRVPNQKQLIDHYRKGKFVGQGNAVYRQTLVIRSSEVDYKKTATMEAILNLMQETSLNHGWVSGLYGDGFAATRAMQKYNLIWVVTRMKVDIDVYPVWGEVIEMDTWLGTSGKIGITRDWIIRSHQTKQVYAHARCMYVMMNQITRRLSKVPEEVRVELLSYFVEKAIKKDAVEKIDKLENNAKYISLKFQPKKSDLDVNQHVNSVKYAKWMFEAIPENVVENYRVSSMTLEYRRECEITETVESLCGLEDYNIYDEVINGADSIIRGFPNLMDDNIGHNSNNNSSFRFTHLLKGNQNEEITRGRTVWKRTV